MEKKLFQIFLITILIFSLSNIGSGNTNDFQLRVGEELTYKVNWSFFRLGTVTVTVNDTVTMDDNLLYHIKLRIDSNPLLFFINMHGIYESYIDNNFKLHLFISDEKIDNIEYKAKYQFDYQDSTLYISMTNKKDTTKTIEKDEPLDENLYDGTTLIFYARDNVNKTKIDTVTSFFESDRGKVIINFYDKEEQVKISALPDEQKSLYIDGIIKMKGVAGLSGPFKGWFAKNNSRPPLRAELKVFLGSVKVELEGWKNWSPK